MNNCACGRDPCICSEACKKRFEACREAGWNYDPGYFYHPIDRDKLYDILQRASKQMKFIKDRGIHLHTELKKLDEILQEFTDDVK